MSISIVTPVYNGEKFITELYSNIKPLLGNNDISWIIVNDASTDNTASIIKNDIINSSGNIRLIDLEKNSGPAIARIEGARESSSKYVFFLDADDYIYQENFYGFVKFILDNTEFDFYYAPLNVVTKRDKENSSDIKCEIAKISNPLGFIFHSFPQPSSLVVRREFFIKYNKANRLEWGEDFLMYLCLGKYGKGLRWNKSVSCYFINGEGRGSILSLKLRMKLSNLLFQESMKESKIISSLSYTAFLTFRHLMSFIYKKYIK